MLEHDDLDLRPSIGEAVPCGRPTFAPLVDERWSSLLDTDRWRRGPDRGPALEPRKNFLIEGWLPSQGSSVWFGAGSTGKTQLMLWMAATIASRGENRTWLGGAVRGTGHVLVLTAEDSEQHVRGRIRDIVRHTLNLNGAVAEETCARLHVMAFLSMTEGEYRHPNASLFENVEKLWRPTAVLEGVRRYIRDWNGRPDEDPIVGVVMDSATSMCGFDSMDGYATTNFFFYLGRLCEALGIFWSIIGHVPKSAQINKRDTRAGAANRLRGVTMWTTAPRLVVEVRQLHEWTDKSREHPALRAMLPDVRREDLLAVYVAKTNLQDVHCDERYLHRMSQGAFEDVTDLAPHPAAWEPSVAQVGEKASRGKPDKERTPRKGSSAPDYTAGTEVVVGLVAATYPALEPGTVVSAAKIYSAYEALPLDRRPQPVVGTPNGGGVNPARIGSATWHLDRLVERGWLEKGKRYRIGNWPSDTTSQDTSA